ncbi:MAG: isochorismate synthase [Myxococcales bacterium]|nr:isochorismate synthase [Myxococcales bacterium]
MTLPEATPRPRSSRPRSGDPFAYARACLDRIARRPGHAVITLPAPCADPVALLAHRTEPSVAWEPPNGDRIVGWGVAAQIEASGSERFSSIRDQATRILSRAEVFHHRDAPDVVPRFFGGFAFSAGSAKAGPWASFGDATFVLPRWTYGRRGSTAWLSLAIDGDGALSEGTRLLGELDELLASMRTRGSLPAEAPDAGAQAVEHLSRDDWQTRVQAATAAISEGDLRKVVVARCSFVQAKAALDPESLLTRLRRSYPECFSFSMRFRDTAFLGAAPERLVQRSGNHVVTEALAGSIDVREEFASERLRESAKDRAEQRFVVQHVLDRLGPYCAQLSHPSEPGVRVLPNLVHLCTPIHGTLSSPVHILDLVALLHPTPAVGGVPTERALPWIAANEPSPRGWYAGPVGWFDREGDGEFAVALRSGLVRGREAWIYAGAGIVEGSDPDAEYQETALKLRAVLGALGIE